MAASVVPPLLEERDSMSEVETLLDQVRAAVEDQGAAAAIRHDGGSGVAPSPATFPSDMKQARRVPPPERLSPSPVSRVQCPHRSPCLRDPPGPAAGLPAPSPSGGPRKNPHYWRELREEGAFCSYPPFSPSLQIPEFAAAPC